MRAERTSGLLSPKPKQPFPKVPARLATTAKPVAPNAAASRGPAHATTSQALQRARAGHVATAAELQRARAGHAHARELLEVRRAPPCPGDVRERLVQALEQPPVPTVPAPSAPSGPTGERGEVPVSSVSSAMKLVERIEVFLRSGRPQLELSVGGAFQAEVLLERTGPREVAVTVRGKNGPPPPQELARLREELQRRGLKLSSLGIR